MKFCFAGQLSVEDMSRHIPHRINVPNGIRTFSAQFLHDPDHPGVGPLPHQLSISVYGPSGARGTRHNNIDQSPIISESWASPGYTPGPIEPGEWIVEIDTARILPPGKIGYTIEVMLSESATHGHPSPAPADVAARGPGWYIGDLHGHSDHSDGSWPVSEFIASARARDLDFVTLTDHNTVSGLAEAKGLAGDDLLVMGGVELTTFNGHCLALGTDVWVEWRIKDGLTMSDHARALMQAGLTYVIAHPMARGHPWCTGCHWAYADVYPGPAKLVEVWNSQWLGDKNEMSLRLYHAWLNQGHRIMATAGTDIHGPEGASGGVGYNRIYAQELSEPAIYSALRAGHNVLTTGPVIDMLLTCGDRETMIGDLAPDCTGELALTWRDVPAGAKLVVIGKADNGVQVIQELNIADEGTFSLQIHDMPYGGWVQAVLRDTNSHMLALTNPIFLPGEWQ